MESNFIQKQKFMKFDFLYIIAIITMASNFFELTKYSHIPGVFRMTDIGLGLVLIGLVVYSFSKPNLGRLENFFSLYVLAYLLFLVIQVAIASMLYQQPLLDGMFQMRHQFYYLMFPIFVLVLDNEKKIENFMKLLTILSILIIGLSILNYSGITIFHHKWALGHGERSGIVRAYIPGMGIIAVTCIWQLNRYLSKDKLISVPLLTFFYLFAGIVFRQTRGVFISMSIVAILMVTLYGKGKQLFFLLVMGMLLVVGAGLFLKHDLVGSNIHGAYSDISKGEGTWEDRLTQISNDIKIFRENIWFGSGGIVLRARDSSTAQEISYFADLGYTSWLKFFGLPGIVLLISMYIGFGVKLLGIWKSMRYSALARFAGFSFLYMVIASVTLSYFNSPQLIPFLCLTWACLQYEVENRRRGLTH